MTTRWKIRIKFEKRDAWVGVFWDIKEYVDDIDEEITLSVCICILPFLPIIVSRTQIWS